MAEYVADKIDAARHSITGSNVSKAICKASSREIMGPKRKHIDCKYCRLRSCHLLTRSFLLSSRLMALAYIA